MLDCHPIPAYSLKHDFKNLPPGRRIRLGEILFQKIEQEKESTLKSSNSAAPTTSLIDDRNLPLFSRVDLRVGKITKIWQHEKAERLFCEEIDIGEETTRAVASALRGTYREEDLLGRLVVVLCNLKEAKLQGFLSNGMVLAAKASDGRMELVDPPPECIVGDRVFCDGIEVSPWPPAKLKKEKAWEAVVVDLKTNTDRRVVWRGAVLRTSKGECVVESLIDAQIS